MWAITVILFLVYIAGVFTSFWFALLDGNRRYRNDAKMLIYAVIVSLFSWLYVVWYYKKWNDYERV